MFCVQCEQTIRTPAGNGCAYAQGMCGKTAETSDLQDVLIYALQDLSAWVLAAREHGVIDNEIDAFVPKAFFATLTNVNFDSARIVAYVNQALAHRQQLVDRLAALAVQVTGLPEATGFEPGDELLAQLAHASQTAVNRGKSEVHEDIMGLRLLCLYGLKGAAAYMEHARVLGQQDSEVAAEFHRIMSWLSTDPSELDSLFKCAMEIGLLNFRVMEMLDLGETTAFGHPSRPKCASHRCRASASWSPVTTWWISS